MAKVKQAIVAKKNESYNASDIRQLPFPENVRTRPQIYLSNLDEYGSLTCLREIVNNSVDEFLRGFCTMINVVRVSEREFIVADNGRGVPFDKHSSGKNALEVIFGELHSGRNFDSAKTEYTTGINGVGASCTNAVSSKFVVTSRRDTAEGRIVFAKGIKQDLKVDKNAKPVKGYKSGTSVNFELDDTLFEGYVSDDEVIKLLRETAYLLACDVAAADGDATEEELVFLQQLRIALEIDRLVAGAIERAARARYQIV